MLARLTEVYSAVLKAFSHLTEAHNIAVSQVVFPLNYLTNKNNWTGLWSALTHTMGFLTHPDAKDLPIVNAHASDNKGRRVHNVSESFPWACPLRWLQVGSNSYGRMNRGLGGHCCLDKRLPSVTTGHLLSYSTSVCRIAHRILSRLGPDLHRYFAAYVLL